MTQSNWSLKGQMLGRRRRRYPSLDAFVASLHQRRPRPSILPLSSRLQDEGKTPTKSHVLIAPGGPCGIRPTVTGPARVSVLRASYVIVFSVMTICNLPMWEYSGDSPDTRGHKRPYQRTVDTRVPINTPVQCP
jgi:hypothetical protein